MRCAYLPLEGEECCLKLLMPGLVPVIHVFKLIRKVDVDGRDKPGHDGEKIAHERNYTAP